LAHRTPFIFVRRDYFNEEPFLRKLLEVHGFAVEITRADFFSGHWGAYLDRALEVRIVSVYSECV
jgi:L-arabinokinase